MNSPRSFENVTDIGLPAVDLVIVNWNTGRHLRECLSSVAGAEHERFRLGDVVVVDNGSVDDSLDGLAELPIPLHILRNAGNRGFAAACNQGAAVGHGDFLLFLNPDTQLFPDTLDRSIAFLAGPGRSKVGMCGGQMLNVEGAPVLSCSRFPTLWMFVGKMFGLAYAFPRLVPNQRLAPEETTESRIVDQVIGAYLLVRRGLFESLGGFDERFFVYLEDVDLAYRARELGYSSYFLKDVRVLHQEGVSSGQVRAKRLFYLLRGRTEYARKHWPRWQAWLLAALILFVELPGRALLGIARGQRGGVRESGEATRLYIGYLLGHPSAADASEAS